MMDIESLGTNTAVNKTAGRVQDCRLRTSNLLRNPKLLLLSCLALARTSLEADTGGSKLHASGVHFVAAVLGAASFNNQLIAEGQLFTIPAAALKKVRRSHFK